MQKELCGGKLSDGTPCKNPAMKRGLCDCHSRRGDVLDTVGKGITLLRLIELVKDGAKKAIDLIQEHGDIFSLSEDELADFAARIDAAGDEAEFRELLFELPEDVAMFVLAPALMECVGAEMMAPA
jgi:hypothetical protein